MRQPLNLYVIKHPQFIEGLEYAKDIYAKIYRDIEKQTIIKSNVPVYFSDVEGVKDNQLNIKFDNAIKIAIVILVDAKMILDKENDWDVYFKKLYDKQKSNSNVRIYPVSFVEQALYCYPNSLNNLNYIRLHEQEIEIRKEYLIMKLRHELCRLLYGMEQVGDSFSDNDKPVRLFLSHAKRDGLEITNKIREYINSDTGISDFFDAVDIPKGKNFMDEIEKSICQSSLVLIVQTDSYVLSEWCKKEVLIAKQNDIPLVVINCIKKGEVRSFPYLGNCKTLRISEEKNMELRIISCAMDEILSKEFFKQKMLINHKSLNKNIQYSVPELISLGYKKDNDMIIYPEPPIGRFEMDVLNVNYSKIEMLTPIMYFLRNNKADLLGKKIAISISETKERDLHGINLLHCHALSVELARYFLVYGADILYGGNINYQVDRNFTETIIETVKNYSKEYGNKRKIINYVPSYINKQISEQQLLEYDEVVEFCFDDNDYDYDNNADSLTNMRKKMTSDMDIRVIAGGKKVGYVGKYPGVLEEFILSIESSKPTYVIGGYGGVSKTIAKLLDGEISDEECMENVDKSVINKIKSMGYRILNNGLDKEDNKKLFVSTNIDETINLIIKGMMNLK
ncbi:MAG: toll/interleukin-1 receptor domain-containing protein [Lachnospiraceae bacterium]|nr:toll/interleukin-1 receptor domain-containing protein [Lachnospiraceae bacterium]